MKFALWFLIFTSQYVLAARLFYLDDSTKGTCQAKTLELPSKKEKVEFTSKVCPKAITWDIKNKKILTMEDGQLWERLMDGTSAKILAQTPQKDAQLWIDQTTQNPRIAYMVEVSEKNVKSQGSEENRIETFTFEGKEYRSRDLPSSGVPYMAIAANYKKGLWARIEMAPTKSNTGDTPGLSILNVYNQKKSLGVNLSDLLTNSTCVGGVLNCSSEDKSVEKLMKDQEEYGVIPTAKGSRFVFAVGFGDTPHAAAPLYYCQGNCQNSIKLKEVTEEQVSLASKGDYLLVATEYDNTNPRIYDGKTGRLVVVIPHAKSAVWLND